MYSNNIISIIAFLLFLLLYFYVRNKFGKLLKKNNTENTNPEDHGVILAHFSSLDAYDDGKIIEIQSYLAENDIDSVYETFVGGDLVNNYHLLVRKGDLEKAQEVLKKYFLKN